jgi:hypothetical protein
MQYSMCDFNLGLQGHGDVNSEASNLLQVMAVVILEALSSCPTDRNMHSS